MTRPLDPDTVFTPSTDLAWRLTEEGFDPLRESSRQSRLVLCNGLLGVRTETAVSRDEQWTVPSRTYIAGLFDTEDRPGSVPALIPVTDHLRLRLTGQHARPAGSLAMAGTDRVDLDFRRGMLLTDCLHREGALAVRIRSLRLVSMRDRSVSLELIRLDVVSGVADMTISAGFDAPDRRLEPGLMGPDVGAWTTWRSGIGLTIGSRGVLTIDGQVLSPTLPGPLERCWTWTSAPGQTVVLDRIAVLSRHRPEDIVDSTRTRQALDQATTAGWRALAMDHEAAWAERWTCSDVEVEGDPAAQTALRFAGYHLNGAANPDDERVSIAARGLTGSDYAGHVFWDTEIFLLPFFIHTWPAAARALLMYRFHTLGAARAKAARLGWRGALYAWESADTGDEATPDRAVGPDRQILEILCGTQEQHVSSDVAYAVWQYWTATGDEAFLRQAGAEILLETARFWASRVEPAADGSGHIRGVIGPDEYHQGVDDNAFTNVMARWTIYRGLEAADLFRTRWPGDWGALSGRLDLDDSELADWLVAAERLVTGLDPSTGLYEQFDGFFGLEKIDVAAYAGRSVPLDVVLGRARTSQSQVIKQADVVALLALLPGQFAGESGAANFACYEPRCGHGSSLSTTMHGLAAARLGQTDLALSYFHRTAEIDLVDSKVAIAGGIHMAAQGGLWQMAVFGFGGVSVRPDGIALAPRLPETWTRLRFPLQWHGRRMVVTIEGERRHVRVELTAGDAMAIWLEGARYDLRPGAPLTIKAANLPKPAAAA